MSAGATPDMDRAGAFAFKVLGDFTAISMGTLNTIADRLGLFKTLSEGDPVTSAEFATRAGLHERYAREWLCAMACHGYIAYDAGSRRFSMTPEQSYVLVNPDSSFYLGSLFGMVPPYYRNLDLLTEAFQHGGGVPQENYGEEFWCGFERITRTAFKNNLVQDWLPALPQADATLRAGGAAADVGCGNGQALLFLAQSYPQARLVGYDSYAPAIDAANANAYAAGLDNRVRYELCDVTGGIPGDFDLITTFDVVHDMPQPRPALREIRRALKPGGTYFMAEFNLYGDLERNLAHPLGLGAFGYSSSINYCLTQALAAGGEGTGTCLGEEQARTLATEAGFGQFRRIDFPANPFNLFYEIRE